MINFLKGILYLKTPTWLELDVQGVGYGVNIPISTFDILPEAGEQVRIYTTLRVREDDMSLYGFASRQEHELFDLLLKVNGIGPKASLAALSTLKVDDIYRAIADDTPEILSAVPGIGKKTAEKIILELNTRIKRLTTEKNINTDNRHVDDSILALTSLGFRQKDVVKTVSSIRKNNESAITTEEIIKLALKKLGKNG